MFPKIVHQSWHEPLMHLWKDPRLIVIQQQLAYFKFAPKALDIFRAFSLPITDVCVVMCALSPYQKITEEGMLYATGLAMGSNVDTKTLESIRDALWNDYHDLRSEDLDLSLELWKDQGVLLLNKALTVTVNTTNPREHIDSFQWSNTKGKHLFPGWKWFTSEVIKVINEQCNAVVFVFLGKDAQEYSTLVDTQKNYLIEVPHPVARYYAAKNGEVPEHLDFSKSGMFKRIDEITYKTNKENIKWYEVKTD